MAMGIMARAEAGREAAALREARSHEDAPPLEKRQGFRRFFRRTRILARWWVRKLMWRLLAPDEFAEELDRASFRVTPARLYRAYPWRGQLCLEQFPDHLAEWREAQYCGDPLFAHLVRELSWCAADRPSCVGRFTGILVDVLSTAEGLGLLDDVLARLVEHELNDEDINLLERLVEARKAKGTT